MRRFLMYAVLVSVACVAISPFVEAAVMPMSCVPEGQPYDHCIDYYDCNYCFFQYGNGDNPDYVVVKWKQDLICVPEGHQTTEVFQAQCLLYWLCHGGMPEEGDYWPCG